MNNERYTISADSKSIGRKERKMLTYSHFNSSRWTRVINHRIAILHSEHILPAEFEIYCENRRKGTNSYDFDEGKLISGSKTFQEKVILY